MYVFFPRSDYYVLSVPQQPRQSQLIQPTGMGKLLWFPRSRI
jgi:hypothetical protein